MNKWFSNPVASIQIYLGEENNFGAKDAEGEYGDCLVQVWKFLQFYVQNCTVWCFLASLANCFFWWGRAERYSRRHAPVFFLLGQYPTTFPTAKWGVWRNSLPSRISYRKEDSCCLACLLQSLISSYRTEQQTMYIIQLLPQFFTKWW